MQGESAQGSDDLQVADVTAQEAPDANTASPAQPLPPLTPVAVPPASAVQSAQPTQPAPATAPVTPTTATPDSPEPVAMEALSDLMAVLSAIPAFASVVARVVEDRPHLVALISRDLATALAAANTVLRDPASVWTFAGSGPAVDQPGESVHAAYLRYQQP